MSIVTHTDIPTVAAHFRTLLAPACQRIEIGGGIRRGKPNPHDIELVGIPIFDTDLFGEPTTTTSDLDCIIAELIESGKFRWDTDVKRRGPKYKRLIVPGIGIPLELFLTTPDGWGWTYLLRTGSAEWNVAMVTSTLQGGLKPTGIECKDGVVYLMGKPQALPSEEDVFKLWDLPYIEPRDRSLETAEAIAHERRLSHAP